MISRGKLEGRMYEYEDENKKEQIPHRTGSMG